MKPFEERLRSARSDYQAAVALSQMPDRLRELIAFNCQQAVEKYVKAVLVFRQVEFQKTHDMDHLLDLIATFDAELASALNARSLTAYAVQIRYAGDRGTHPKARARATGKQCLTTTRS